LQRIATFREALIAVDRVGADEKQIEFTETSEDKLVLENLEIATPTGCAKLDQSHVDIVRGDRVLIVGESGAVISIGRSDSNSHFFTRVLRIIKEPAGRCFRPDISAHGFGHIAEALGNSAG